MVQEVELAIHRREAYTQKRKPCSSLHAYTNYSTGAYCKKKTFNSVCLYALRYAATENLKAERDIIAYVVQGLSQRYARCCACAYQKWYPVRCANLHDL